MLRLRSLASGSTGNATVVEGHDGTHRRRLLVDCGLGIRQVATRLERAGLAVGDLDAIFVTHEHSDHIGCVQALSVRHRIPVWMSRGTFMALGEPDFDGLLRVAADGQAIDLGVFEALPFTVPHDAREPLHLRCSDGASHLGLLTDLGHATPHVLAHMQGCNALLLESNHDPEMLAVSRYPDFLKRRIRGSLGHLGNDAAAALLTALRHPGLRRVAGGHLSRQNNLPELARAGLAAALQWAPEQIDIADPQHGTDWIPV
jgi:phosphoribosyl 1,2-cyclic phosphodiesterase